MFELSIYIDNQIIHLNFSQLFLLRILILSFLYLIFLISLFNSGSI